MVYDMNMLQQFYAAYAGKTGAVRRCLGDRSRWRRKYSTATFMSLLP